MKTAISNCTSDREVCIQDEHHAATVIAKSFSNKIESTARQAAPAIRSSVGAVVDCAVNDRAALVRTAAAVNAATATAAAAEIFDPDACLGAARAFTAETSISRWSRPSGLEAAASPILTDSCPAGTYRYDRRATAMGADDLSIGDSSSGGGCALCPGGYYSGSEGQQDVGGARQ